ncbi:MAG: D-aminoacyl-tRNA deacylase [Thermoanaerobaculia bacterium]|nr:D-aminoacyl-tRNA deacylase [Thermoanaerobaculia bacterium]
MRAVLQRVSRASVVVADEVVGSVDRGILVLVAAEDGDGPADVAALADKLTGLRLFQDQAGKMNLDIRAAGGDFLVVSQFTLAASLRKGRRPSFNAAARPEVAEPLVQELMSDLADRGHRVEGGIFGAHMNVHLVNDGPVTFVIDVRDGKVL